MDLIQIENWLNFTDYAQDFLANKENFVGAYLEKRKPSADYFQKRQIYHMYRSLEYLMAMFDGRVIVGDDQATGYVEKHFKMFENVISGRIPELTIF